MSQSLLIRPSLTLLTGDSCQVLKDTYPSNTFDACITDPPYGVGIDKHWDKEIPQTDHWRQILESIKPGAYCVAFGSPRLYHQLATNMAQAGFEITDMMMWIVTNKMVNPTRLKPAHEPICVAQKPCERSAEYNMAKWGVGKLNIDEARIPWKHKGPKWWNHNPDGRHPSNVVGYLGGDYEKYFYAPTVSEMEKGYYNDHPTTKPIDLMRYLNRLFCLKQKVVLDPFMGSGSTGLAAIQEGRSFVGIEKEQHYVDIAQRRFAENPMPSTPNGVGLDKGAIVDREQKPFQDFIRRNFG